MICKRKISVFAAASILAVSTGVCMASPVSSGETNAPATIQKNTINQYKIDLALAPIMSQSDLVNYMGNMPKSSPLRMLSAAGRASFINSLVFGEKGLGSFNYAVLQSELTPSQIYRVLSLFGMQRTTSLITGAAETTRTDRTIMATPDLYAVLKSGAKSSALSPQLSPVSGIGDGDHTDYRCESRATCTESNFDICTSNC